MSGRNPTGRLFCFDAPREIEGVEIGCNLASRCLVILFGSKVQQFAGILQPNAKFVEDDDNLFELRSLLSQGLSTLGFIPDVGLLEFATNFGQAFGLAVVVKDTSSTHRSVRQGR